MIEKTKTIYASLASYGTKVVNNCKKNMGSFITLFVIFALSFYPIFRANVEYVDDAQRKFNGNPAFDYFSRFISHYMSQVINTNSYLADISPLPQFIAIVFLCLSALCVLKLFLEDKKITLIHLIAVIPIGLNPYFLECISYKFDSPYMALSILASVAPLLFRKKNPVIYMLSIFCGVLVMCMTYQAASGIFPTLVAIYAFYAWNGGEKFKKVFAFLSYSVVGYLAGLVVFKKLIMIPRSDFYAGNRMFPLSEMPQGIFNNLKTFYTYVKNDFDTKWLVFIIVILISFIVLSVVNSKQKKWLALILSIVSVVIFHVLAYGVYIALVAPLFEARGMYCYGVLIACIAVVCTTYNFSHVAKIAAICLSYCFIVFSFLYGNALAEQKRFVEYRSELVLNDLNDLDIMNQEGTKQIQIVGTIGKSPIITNMPQYNGVLKRIVQTTLGGSGWIWNEYYFRYYHDLTDVIWVVGLEEENLPLIEDNYYQTIYGEGDKILIQLKDK